MKIRFTLDEQRDIRRRYFEQVAFRNISGYLSWNVLVSMIRTMRPSMLAAALREFAKTHNIRDAMQAYVHALRKYHAARYARRKKESIG